VTGMILDASFRRALHQRLPLSNLARLGEAFVQHIIAMIDDAQVLYKQCVERKSEAFRGEVAGLLARLNEPFIQYKEVLFPAGERIFRWGPVHGCPFWYPGGCAINEHKPWRCRGFYSRDRLLTPLSLRFSAEHLLRAHIAPINRTKLLQWVRLRNRLGSIAWEPLYIFGIRDAAPQFVNLMQESDIEHADFLTTEDLAEHLIRLQSKIQAGTVPDERGYVLHHHGPRIGGSVLQHITVHHLIRRPVLLLFDSLPDQIIGGDFNVHMGGPTRDVDSGFLANEAYVLNS